MRMIGITLLGVLLTVQAAPAQDRGFVLLADERLEQSGLLAFLLPRFVLKYRIRPEVRTAAPGSVGAGAGAADLVLALVGEAEGGKPVFFRPDSEPEETYAVALVPGATGAEHAEVFRDWLAGDVGRATIDTFLVDGVRVYVPGAPDEGVVEAVVIEGDADAGERLALIHCGRCHVVSEKNRMGGIGSTPSFAALRTIPGWESRFQAFWSENPHPSFTQVEGVTEPFDPMNPPHIAPVEITLEDIDAILAYAASIEPKDLGAPISQR